MWPEYFWHISLPIGFLVFCFFFRHFLIYYKIEQLNKHFSWFFSQWHIASLIAWLTHSLINIAFSGVKASILTVHYDCGCSRCNSLKSFVLFYLRHQRATHMITINEHVHSFLKYKPWTRISNAAISRSHSPIRSIGDWIQSGWSLVAKYRTTRRWLIKNVSFKIHEESWRKL